MKEIYACSTHSNDTVVISSRLDSFEELSDLLQTVYGIKKETLGTCDVTVSGKDIPLLEAGLEVMLKDKLKVFQEFKFPNTSITLFGRQYELDTKDDEHRAIHSFGVLLQMAIKEMKDDGIIRFYSIPKFNEMDVFLLRLFKAEQDGIEQRTAFEQFRTWSAEFAAIPVDEFKHTLEVLKGNNFIIDKDADDGEKRWYPTEKSLRIRII